MNHLIVFMHPDKNSFNGALLKEYKNKLIDLGNTVTVRYLYEDNFQPLLSQKEYDHSLQENYLPDIKTEHEEIEKADVISFIFPFWWGGFPASGKGYIDRVFSYGFAYKLKGESPVPLLSGKKAVLIFTTGTPEEEMHESGMYENFKDLTEKSIFQFCGIELEKTVHFGDVIQCTVEEREKMLRRVKETAESLSGQNGRKM